MSRLSQTIFVFMYPQLCIYLEFSLELVNLNLAEESMFVETSCVPIVVVLCLCRHFNTDSLICDCNLKWVLQWARNASVRIAEETVCAYPSALHGLSLYNLKENQLICGELYSDLALKIEGESKENTKKPKKPQKHRKQTKPDRYVAQKIHLRIKKNRKKQKFLIPCLKNITVLQCIQ